MNSRTNRPAALVASIGVLFLACGLATAQPGPRRAEGVYKDRLTPHWLPDIPRFWYRNDLSGGAREFILVDAREGVRRKAFDHEKLAAALSKMAGSSFSADKLPFTTVAFVDDGKAVVFKVADKAWKCDLASYTVMAADASLAPPDESPQERRGPRRNDDDEDQPRRDRKAPAKSPDGKLTASIKDFNVYVREGDAGPEAQLSTDGVEGNSYGLLEWSPDSKRLVAWRIEPGDRKEVYLVQSSPPGGGRAKLEKRRYPLPGDKFPLYELNLFEVASRKQIKPEVDRFEHEWIAPEIHWRQNGQRLAYQKIDRGHQRLRVIEVDATSGEVRNLVDDRSETFIWTAHTENLGLDLVNWLKQSDELIYVSEKDGWRHLYLVDPTSGEMNQITKGEWVIRGIDSIDEKARQIWFRACGMYPDQDPYFVYYYKVGFDGQGLTALTEGIGNHSAQYSPDRAYLIDTYSRVDAPPVHTLRRTSDGALVCELEKADITELQATGWRPPEVFVAKGRDGKTDIWGIITRPRNLDPARKYPVIEQIYNGPQAAYVPKSFSGMNRFAALNDLGFIVVQMDAMGTAFRSKAFHDVCWHNLKDAGFPDRILWHQAAAKRYPYYDLSRVGIYGNSAGGQNAAAALLFHPDFYRVGVASCGCHDNRMDKASWNEQWMGYPVGPQYAECSNIDNAARLRGKLMLVVGEMDTNVPPESTYRFVDALIRAEKDFDFLMVPNANHGPGGPYGIRRMQDYFVRHLLGVEPPDRNGTQITDAKSQETAK